MSHRFVVDPYADEAPSRPADVEGEAARRRAVREALADVRDGRVFGVEALADAMVRHANAGALTWADLGERKRRRWRQRAHDMAEGRAREAELALTREGRLRLALEQTLADADALGDPALDRVAEYLRGALGALDDPRRRHG